jgi:acetyltransferase-like isoleucine patch superfamily enzyme
VYQFIDNLKDVLPYTVVAGVPARLKKRIDLQAAGFLPLD